MPRRHVLYVDAGQLVAWRWRAGEAGRRDRFANDADGHARFRDFLRQRKDSLYTVLCDLADESFVAEHVPHVRGADRTALLRRKLAQHFFGTPLVCAHALGRQRDGRRDEHMLFCALTRPATIEPWLAALRDCEVALCGLHSVPLVGESILRRLRLAEGQTLLLGITSAGVRQSFFEQGKLRFSRLTPLSALSSNDLPRACAEEARRLHPYLLGQRLLARDTPLVVRVLVPPERLDDFAQACRSYDGVQFELMDSAQAALRLGLRRAPTDPTGDALFVQALMRDTPDNQFAAAPDRHHFRLWQARFALRAAGSVALAACLLHSAHSALDSFDLRQQTLRLQDDTARAVRARSDIIARLPPTPVPLDTLRGVHERSLQLERRSEPPDLLMQELGEELAGLPDIALDRLEWRLVPDTAAPSADALPAMRAELTLQAHLPGEYGNRQRRALEAVEMLVGRLRARSGLEVQVLRQPFDLESGQVLRGGSGAEQTDAGKPPSFSLRIVRPLSS